MSAGVRVSVGGMGVLVGVAVGNRIIPVGVAVEVGGGVGVRDGVGGAVAVPVVVGVGGWVPVGEGEGLEVLVADGVGLPGGGLDGWTGSKRPIRAITPPGLTESTAPSEVPVVCIFSPPGWLCALPDQVSADIRLSTVPLGLLENAAACPMPVVERGHRRMQSSQ